MKTSAVLRLLLLRTFSLVAPQHNARRDTVVPSNVTRELIAMKRRARMFLFFAVALTGLSRAEAQAVNWVQIPSPSGSPFSRCCVGIAFDVDRGSHLLFGGADASGNPLGDTWQLRQGQWIQLFPANGVSPPPRQGPGMVYDGATDTVVLFGGTNGATNFDDTWIWNGKTATWTQLFLKTKPPGRRFDTQGMTFDVDHGKVVMFGGYAAGSVFNDTWNWDGKARLWTHRFPTVSPSARRAPIAYDRATEQVILFGGDDGGANQYSDTWTWNGTNWRLRVTPVAPGPRGLASLAYDPALHAVVLFGGFINIQVYSDTWTWNGSVWTQLNPTNVPPDGRFAFGMDYDPIARGPVIFGGFSTGFALFDTWILAPLSEDD
jgi:galactose oxidase-like protein